MNRVIKETPNLRWFDTTGFQCRQCGKRADGNLMSDRNESYGAHCQRCADKRLKDSKQVNEMLAKQEAIDKAARDAAEQKQRDDAAMERHYWNSCR